MAKRVKRALILGSALCLWEDVESALSISEFDGVVAAKRAGVVWTGDLDAWVTLHPDRMLKDIQEREANGYSKCPRIYSHYTEHLHPGITHRAHYRFENQKSSGSSGLFAVKVAMSLGFNKLVLCGIPLTREAGRIGSGPKWNGAKNFMVGFKEALPYIKDNTRSMSGWTAELLGKPTKEWFTE